MGKKEENIHLRAQSEKGARTRNDLSADLLLFRLCRVIMQFHAQLFFVSYFILISIVVLSVQIEDVYRREQVERFNQRLREFEEDQRAYRNHHHGVGVHGVGVGIVGADRPPVETELVDVSSSF